MTEPHVEALLAAGYALFLLLAAAGIDLMARHSQARSERYRTAGFDFHEHLDAWLCPEGEHLHRVEADHRMRVVRYRARAHVCNQCPAKSGCTDSSQGREVTRAMDPWPHSEAGRFHRGIALVMVGMAALVVVVAGALLRDPADLLVLGAALAATLAVGARLSAAFLATPANFSGDEERSAPEALLERRDAGVGGFELGTRKIAGARGFEQPGVQRRP